MHKTKSVLSRAVVGAAFGFLAVSTASQAADPMTSATGGSVAKDDRTFVEKAAIGGMTEVQAGQVASEKATNPDVKKYGAQMVTDHTKANEKLMKIATSKSVTPPATLDKAHKSDVDKLGKQSGGDFDKAFMKQMVADHKTTISLFEKEAKSGKDGDLKAFASATLPTLQEHLKMAQSLNDSLK